MYQRWHQWNEVSRKWLWILIVAGIIASLPLVYDRIQTENTAKKVEFVFNYRGLLEVATYQANPQKFMDEQMDRLKRAGVTTFALFESNLEELKKARRIMIYTAPELANLNNSVITPDDNNTYVLFTSEENASVYESIITDTFKSLDISVTPWQFRGQKGLKIATSPEDAQLKPMQPDPIAMDLIKAKGFLLLPRMSDTIRYDHASVDKLLGIYEQYGIKRILFEGESVKGYNDNEELDSLYAFADALTKHGIGITVIENLKKPQLGMNKLAYLVDYNVVRLYSNNELDANLEEDVLADRFALAVKDRKISMIYLNAAPSKDLTKSAITDPIDNLVHTLLEPGDAIQRIESGGYELGPAEPFVTANYSWEKIAKAVVILGGVAFVALLISYFIPSLALASLLIGLIGIAGLYVLKPELMEQGLALAVSISGPSVAVILAVRKVWKINELHPTMTTGRRMVHSLVLFIKTSIISLSAVPFIIALLNSITYSLVLTQFRGVSLLHFAPIMLVAIYVFLYHGTSVYVELRRWLKMPITLLWIVVAGILGVAGMYYMSRTGNSGSLLPGEATFRALLENSIGVRPRNKEFLLGHPLFIAGVFVAFRYPKAVYALIIATIAQLSMVDTFAHIHSPVIISFIRGLLGMGLGLIIGLIAILIWQLIERCWKKWSPLILKP